MVLGYSTNSKNAEIIAAAGQPFDPPCAMLEAAPDWGKQVTGPGVAITGVRDALAGYFDELAQVRSMLDSRYDDLRNGRVSLVSSEVSSEEGMARFCEKSAARRS